MKIGFLHMDLFIMNSNSLSSENYKYTSVYMEHFYEVDTSRLGVATFIF